MKSAPGKPQSANETCTLETENVRGQKIDNVVRKFG